MEGMNLRKLTIALALCPLLLASPVMAEDVVLTEELVTRYEQTFPEMWPLNKKLDEVGKMRDSEEKKTKTSLLLANRDKILKAHGWADLWEYMDTMNRITPAYVALSVLSTFLNRPESDPDRQKVEAGVGEQLKEKGYSEDEIKIVTQHLPTLEKIRRDAGM
jgi:hypothetical protein